jgi:hypothetical protein
MLAVSWPQRYFAALVGDRIGLFDSTGALVAREGDYLTMGGGGPNPFAACPPNSIEQAVPGSDVPPTPPPGSLTESQALSVAFRALDMPAEQPVRVSGAIESSFGTVAPGSGGDNANAIVWAFTFSGPFDVAIEGPWSACESGGTNGCPSSALIAVDVTSGNVVVNSYTSLSPGASVAPLPTNPWWLGNEPTTCGFPAVYRIEAEPGIVGLGRCDSTFGSSPRSINLLAGARIDLHMRQQFLGPPVFPVPVTSDDSVVRLVTEGQTDATFEAIRPGTAELLTTGGCLSTKAWSCALAIVNVFATGASAPPTLPPTAPCPSEPLRLQGSLTGGGTGTAQLDLKITNFAAVECPFFGAPADVSLLRADGTTLAITPRTTTDGPPVAGIVLDPGGSAEVAYNWSNWCGPDPRPLSVRLTLASGTTLVGPVSGPSGVAFIPRCDGPEGMSHLEFVWGFEAATTP